MNKLFILDFGSGNTCNNDNAYIKKMIDALFEIDTGKKNIVIKWQLFDKAGDNKPLIWKAFHFAHEYALLKGYKTTASVFDAYSLKYLIRYRDIPFVKIANNPSLYRLTRLVPPGKAKWVISSSGQMLDGKLPPLPPDTKLICCVSKYPAKMSEYEKEFSEADLRIGISDHTANWGLFDKYLPETYECHFKLEDSTGLDAGSFARTPAQLKELL